MSGILPPGATELLAPARDLECGRAAIDCGADAVYIGAAQFGAREAVGNSLEDIAALATYAHRYWARVYVALNTLFHDRELPAAARLAREVSDAGADALIIQDVGLLECDLPPLPLVASTQMHNHTPERVAFLERVGFRRAILARELSLDEIRAIRRAAPTIELECFVHGSLCVCESGQCYLSLALGGRSGNRGQCAQPCRKPYRLTDAHGRPVHQRSHLLSLHDLNLSGQLPELLSAGVTSFKIEGRLKDRAYVANVVAHYRGRLDAALRERGLARSSSGTSAAGFAPDPRKAFNRGFTRYFLHGRTEKIGRPSTPKMLGEEVGRVTGVAGAEITAALRLELTPGDGLCFFDATGELRGTSVNAVRGAAVTLQHAQGIRAGTTLYRNHDQAFLAGIKAARPERRLGVRLTLRGGADGVSLLLRDEDGVEIAHRHPGPFDAARDAEAARATVRRQLARTGESAFACLEVAVECAPVPFLPVSLLNALRREALALLSAERERRRPRIAGGAVENDTPYPERELSYRGNVLNAKAAAFYRRHGVTRIEPAAEAGLDLTGRTVMTTRYCLKHQLGLCREPGAAEDAAPEPFYLEDDEGHRLRLDFDCSGCRMAVVLV